MYWVDNEIGAAGKKRQNDLKRVERRVRDALGDIDKLPLKSFSKTTHRRQYRDYYLNYRKRDGERMDPESMQRECAEVRFDRFFLLRFFPFLTTDISLPT